MGAYRTSTSTHVVPVRVRFANWSTRASKPTRSNISLRHILDPDSSLYCVLCGRRVEISTHLFLH